MHFFCNFQPNRFPAEGCKHKLIQLNNIWQVELKSVNWQIDGWKSAGSFEEKVWFLRKTSKSWSSKQIRSIRFQMQGMWAKLFCYQTTFYQWKIINWDLDWKNTAGDFEQIEWEKRSIIRPYRDHRTMCSWQIVTGMLFLIFEAQERKI